MNPIDDAFVKLVGRRATGEEQARLGRVRDALGLRDNDAFWAIVVALEHYDSFFRRYPKELAEEAGKVIENARAAFAKAAENEAARAQRLLSEQVAKASLEVARRLAERRLDFGRVTLAVAAVVAFGALCVTTGYVLGGPQAPFWAGRASDLQGGEKIFSEVLNAPAGWMVFALLLPAAWQGTRFGWRTASAAGARSQERVLGWAMVGLSVAGMVACAGMLARLTGLFLG